MNETQKNTVFTTIGSNVAIRTDNAALKESFYLLWTHLAAPHDSITF